LPDDFPYPAVLKPRDGAGSQGVRLVHSAADVVEKLPNAMRLEAFVRGQSASVAAVCGPRGNVILPACSQRLTGDGCFSYLGGCTPLASEMAGRAQVLAQRTISALPSTCGYVGIDMVLGEGGSPDVVIEVNPRLTTSYVGLRQLVRENLAAAMLHTADGDPPVLSLHPGRVEFTADDQAVRHT
jgi:predicted ATP-grasp superfamily ATP-dependent carboligase